MNTPKQKRLAPREPTTWDTQPAALPLFSNETLIAELKRRGYKVYPSKRVRTYRAAGVIGDHIPPEAIERAVRYEYRTQTDMIARELARVGAIIQTTEEDSGKLRLMSAMCIVLPKTFDFEAEAKRDHAESVAQLLAKDAAAKG